MNIKLDPEVINKLKMVPIEEWGLFDNYDNNIMHNQMQFLADVIIKKQPKTVLEIGTNHSYFPYFINCICPGVKIDTVDINSNAEVGVKILKDAGVDVTFHNKSSWEFFKEFKEPVDFVWVDGSHTKEDCLQDLLSCYDLGIPTICVDDFRSNDGVFRAVFEFFKMTDYYLYDQSYIMDLRGIICFTKEPK